MFVECSVCHIKTEKKNESITLCIADASSFFVDKSIYKTVTLASCILKFVCQFFTFRRISKLLYFLLSSNFLIEFEFFAAFSFPLFIIIWKFTYTKWSAKCVEHQYCSIFVGNFVRDNFLKIQLKWIKWNETLNAPTNINKQSVEWWT